MPFQVGHKNTPIIPRFAPGEEVDDWTVLDYLGHSYLHPETDKELAKRYHWYRVKCACGDEETLNQAQIMHRGRCLSCSADIKGMRISQTKKPNSGSDSSDVPNFATLKW